ncbi:MAG: hypothetical protein D6790_14295, partial [Caldilineae bacterium]
MNPIPIDAIVNGWFPTGGEVATHPFVLGAILLAGGRIQAIQEAGDRPGGSILDASGCTVLPGFIDVHIHGSAGADTMDATLEAHRTMSRFLVQHGVTSYVATTVTAPPAATLAAVQGAAQAGERPVADGARLLGVHLEGPYLSPRFPGAQPKAHLRA